VVVGLVFAAHVVALHVHGEHLADFLDSVRVVHAPDEPGAVQFQVAFRVGEDVENRVDGRLDGAFHSDFRVVAHGSTLPKDRRLGNNLDEMPMPMRRIRHNDRVRRHGRRSPD
jgi:hypothetical protein